MLRVSDSEVEQVDDVFFDEAFGGTFRSGLADELSYVGHREAFEQGDEGNDDGELPTLADARQYIAENLIHNRLPLVFSESRFGFANYPAKPQFADVNLCSIHCPATGGCWMGATWREACTACVMELSEAPNKAA